MVATVIRTSASTLHGFNALLRHCCAVFRPNLCCPLLRQDSVSVTLVPLVLHLFQSLYLCGAPFPVSTPLYLCGAPLTDWQACVWDLGSPSVHADKGKPAKILFKITIPHQLLPHLCPANRGIKIEEDSFVPSFSAAIRR